MLINEVHDGVERNRGRKRLGRGPGSGTGKTAGRGHKGQKSRSGSSRRSPAVFEGGQMPLSRRIPKRGFNNGRFRKNLAIVNLDDLERCFAAGTEVGPAALRQAGLVKGRNDGIKILSTGQLTKALTVTAQGFSQAARSKIEQAGGHVIVA